MSQIRAILIEDEPSGMENLRWKLESNCPEVEIVAECGSGEEAILAIKRFMPDVIFLDILLGDMTGFDVLKAIRNPSFEVIFTTSYDEYAIEAIKNSALDYLLKPVEVSELIDAVFKARSKLLQSNQIQSRRIAPVPQTVKVGFPVSTGQQFIDVKEIIYVEADDNVSVLHLPEKVNIRLTKALSWVEAKLEEYGFCRVHNSYLVNFQQMTEYMRNDGGYVVMSNGKVISISRRRKENFMNQLENWNGKT